jgi:hypothetical protein
MRIRATDRRASATPALTLVSSFFISSLSLLFLSLPFNCSLIVLCSPSLFLCFLYFFPVLWFIICLPIASTSFPFPRWQILWPAISFFYIISLLLSHSCYALSFSISLLFSTFSPFSFSAFILIFSLDFRGLIHLFFVVFYHHIFCDLNFIPVFQSVVFALKKWTTWSTSTLMSRSTPGKLSSSASTVSWVSS